MENLPWIIVGILFLLAAVGVFFCVFVGIPVTAYFFSRVFLKVFGFYSEPPEKFRREVKLFGTCLAVLIATGGCFMYGLFIAMWSGLLD